MEVKVNGISHNLKETVQQENNKWELARDIVDEWGYWLIKDSTGDIVAMGNSKENAELICKAVNNFK